MITRVAEQANMQCMTTDYYIQVGRTVAKWSSETPPDEIADTLLNLAEGILRQSEENTEPLDNRIPLML